MDQHSNRSDSQNGNHTETDGFSSLSFSQIKEQAPHRPKTTGADRDAGSAWGSGKPQHTPQRPQNAVRTEAHPDASDGYVQQPTQPIPTLNTNPAAGAASDGAGEGDALGKAEPVRRSAATPAAPEKHTADKRRKKKKRSKTERTIGDDPVLHSLIRAVIYIVCVLVVSAFAAWMIIAAANDVFAFVKDDAEVTVEITPDMDIGDVSQMLRENNLIKYPTLFRLYCKIKDVTFEPCPGSYDVTAQLNYNEFIQTFNNYKISSRQQVVITIPEGYDVDEIIEYLVEEKGVGTREGYLSAINDYEYNTEEFRFLRELPDNPNRKYRLEGYLFPDTYYIYQDSNEITVIYKMLLNTQSKLTDEYYDVAKESGMTMDQVITLASMIQAEAKYSEEYGLVSQVFHNRLNHSDIFPKLESDATTRYAVGNRTEKLTREQLASTNQYNTYVYPGLPPGAICNPGLDAIRYALYPTNQIEKDGQMVTVEYYYFVADNDGHSVFSTTKEEHDAAVQRIAAEGEQ